MERVNVRRVAGNRPGSATGSAHCVSERTRKQQAAKRIMPLPGPKIHKTGQLTDPLRAIQPK